MGERSKRWRPWDLNRLAADIAAEILGPRTPVPRRGLTLRRRAPQEAPRQDSTGDTD